MHEERGRKKKKRSKSSGDACLTLLSAIKSDQLSEEMLGIIQK